MKLDIFNHIFPKIYFDKMMEVAPNHKDMGKRAREGSGFQAHPGKMS